jgi:thymidylate synthase (FAD)
MVTDYMGDEAAIIESARISYGGGNRRELSKGDIGLLRYLIRHHHNTPIESCELKVRMELPIFVARQLVRHRTASLNEVSARYTELQDKFYIPADDVLQPQSQTNKQGREGILTPEQKHQIKLLLEIESNRAYNNYQTLLGNNFSKELNKRLQEVNTRPFDERPQLKVPASLQADENYPGLARELARMGLTLNTYTQWIWKIDTHNLLHFIGLRSDPHAQYEIRVYSDKLCEIMQGWMPNLMSAFYDYKMDAVLVSGPEWEILRKYLQDTPQGIANDFSQCERMSKREREELWYKIFGTKGEF